jgi:hypothetical protein
MIPMTSNPVAHWHFTECPGDGRTCSLLFDFTERQVSCTVHGTILPQPGDTEGPR